MPTAFEILILLLLILANGLFAMTEIAVVSSRKARLQQMAEDGSAGARTALLLAEDPNRLLSTIQVGITLIGVLSGALGGATLAGDLAPVIAKIPWEWIQTYSYQIAFVLIVIVITYLSLVLGELVPKRLGLNDPEGVAVRMARGMNGLSNAAQPLVRLLSVSTDAILRLLGMRESQEPPVTNEEIKILLEQGTQVGVFEAGEQDLVESVFRFSDRSVDAMMTPRTEVTWLDLDDSLEVNLQKVRQSPHLLLPVAQGSLDNVQGILNVRDLLDARLEGGAIDLRALLEPPIFVPESAPALKVLEMVKNTGLPMVLVMDEYGGVLGMVTLLDILRAIVGNFSTTGETPDPLVVHREDDSWLLDGLLRVDEMKELLDMDDLPDEERVGYQTLGGMMMSQFGDIPRAGQSFEWGGYRFEVVDMDQRRVDKVLVTPLAGSQEASTNN
ncbi:hemolysin family protein [Levilinea saccharolytica]|uniref:Hemolysins n=1 Tax=Levilinea saccharolytica TaxID=229921 RepID=A0A0M8JRX0_9CHLR|nr:hemolysin family protein [Levilinea saccharolytica]KPL91971.1 hypothetical protein ADN01_00015 [Levilinea saccharolytica]GAP19235.1 hemolysins [Levilinea saccharolytica]